MCPNLIGKNEHVSRLITLIVTRYVWRDLAIVGFVEQIPLYLLASRTPFYDEVCGCYSRWEKSENFDEKTKSRD
jgi:hypothetical protein